MRNPTRHLASFDGGTLRPRMVRRFLWAVMVTVVAWNAAPGQEGLKRLPIGERKVTRFVRYQAGETIAYGILNGHDITRIEGDLFGAWKKTTEVHKLQDVKLLVPTKPSQVLALKPSQMICPAAQDIVVPPVPAEPLEPALPPFPPEAPAEPDVPALPEDPAAPALPEAPELPPFPVAPELPPVPPALPPVPLAPAEAPPEPLAPAPPAADSSVGSLEPAPPHAARIATRPKPREACFMREISG